MVHPDATTLALQVAGISPTRQQKEAWAEVERMVREFRQLGRDVEQNAQQFKELSASPIAVSAEVEDWRELLLVIHRHEERELARDQLGDARRELQLRIDRVAAELVKALPHGIWMRVGDWAVGILPEQPIADMARIKMVPWVAARAPMMSETVSIEKAFYDRLVSSKFRSARPPSFCTASFSLDDQEGSDEPATDL